MVQDGQDQPKLSIMNFEKFNLKLDKEYRNTVKYYVAPFGGVSKHC